ncbi:MAG TPA: retropepsin-like aspartic protease [Gallionellaceae bacterium]|nr:retropepsin-like aspartic protease [Gallionellaceae bacterium]
MTRRLLVLALCVSLPAHAAIFKCKKADGSFMYQEKPCAAETQSVGTVNTGGGGVEMDSKDPRDAKAAFYIDQAANGHYFVNGTVNDIPLNFVVDTGASVVSLPGGVANAANLHCEQMVRMNTANGVAAACKVMISKLTFGKFIVRNVEAVISPNLSQPLLGMNVLSRFNVEQHNGQMSLTRPD